MSILCPNCGTECEDHYTFCSGCGNKIDFSLKCKNCQNPHLFEQSFCIKCGFNLYTKKQMEVSNLRWKLFPVSIILYSTILIIHIMFFLIFRESAAQNIAVVSIFDALMIIIWASFPAYNIKNILKLKYDFKLWHIAFFLGGIIIGFAFALGFVKLLQIWLELPQTSMVKKMLETGHSMTGIILIVCVQPAIIEELAFRGIVYKALENALKPKETIFISAFLFAMLHLSLITLPHLMLLGIFFGYIRYKTGSIIPSVIAHFIHNFSAVMIDKYNLF